MTKEIEAGPPKMVRFDLFGSFEAYADGASVDLGAKRERRLLVALLSAESRRVSRSELVEWIWDDVPADPARACYEVASGLRRKCLDPLGLTLVCKDGWYQLAVPGECVDVHRFRALTGRALEVDDDHRVELLDEALRLCRGVPLSGLDGRRIDAYRDQLTEDRRTVEVLGSQIDLRRRRGEERIPVLRRLLRERPDDSRVTGLLMYALHQFGSTAEAITVYHDHKEQLAENGVKVPPRLRDLHVRIARGDQDLSPEADVFLGGKAIPSDAAEPIGDAGDDNAADAEQERRAQVVNRILAPVTGRNVVFGIQNQVR